MKKYKIGVIGHGGFGRFCIQNYKKMEQVEIAAVAGKDASEVEKFAIEFEIPFWTADYKDILKQKNIDIVAIFTPPFLHFEMACECARAGKAFLVEKPLALSLKEAGTIIELAKQHNVPATIGYVMRYSSIYSRVREIMRSGKLGRLKRLLFENYASGALPDSHWLFDQNKSGGLLVEHGVHFFDIFGSIVGENPLQAKSYTPSPRETLAVIEYPNKIIATFYHCFDKIPLLERNYARLVFEKGYIEIEGWIPMALKWEHEDESGQIVVKEEKIQTEKNEEYGKLVREVLADLLEKVENPSHQTKVTLKDGFDSLALAIEARDHQVF
ncbi:MAG: Gfo/Idh/MocA family oxidoreductase [bacterium]|nr:Gfo/Idh/MocA family oxidoreductase [bacterium]